MARRRRSATCRPQRRTLRSFGVDPTVRLLLAANQDSDSVVTFRVDPDTGKLQHTGQATHVPTPVCVKFLPGSVEIALRNGA